MGSTNDYIDFPFYRDQVDRFEELYPDLYINEPEEEEVDCE